MFASNVCTTRSAVRFYASERSEALLWYAQMYDALWLPLLPWTVGRWLWVPGAGPLHNCQSCAGEWEAETAAVRESDVQRWGFEARPMLLPINMESRDGYRDAYKLYDKAVRKWQRLLKWGEQGRACDGGREESDADSGEESEKVDDY